MIKTKKSLGQNFFVNENLARQSVQIIKSTNPEVIVEIGPGQGYFSKFFVDDSTKVIMIEKDDVLAQNLSYTIKNGIVVNEDFLEWDFKELAQYKRENITFFGSLPFRVG